MLFLPCRTKESVESVVQAPLYSICALSCLQRAAESILVQSFTPCGLSYIFFFLHRWEASLLGSANAAERLVGWVGLALGAAAALDTGS